MKPVEDIIKDAQRVLIISGAGLSKASGIPTFRDLGTGLWENHNVDEVSHANADMKVVSTFYQERYKQYSVCTPNAAHYACADLEKLKDVLHVTQNVDGLLQKAGCKNVIDIHGTFSKWTCIDCGTQMPPSEDFVCPNCGSKVIRPNVVLFGECLDDNEFNTAVQFLKLKAHVIITIGSSGVVSPVAQWTSLAKGRQIPVIAINPEKPNNHFDIWLSGKCEEVLPAIVKDLQG